MVLTNLSENTAGFGKDSRWPWTSEPAPIWAQSPDWPRISVVTPSLNQVKFIEQTIRSVIMQGYPNLEYIIIDGGSTDGSVEIIRKYENHLAYWVSEPDRGQSHAINKGFSRATGEILCWLNSDDYYFPGTLFTAAETLRTGTGNYALVGDCVAIFEDGSPPFEGRGRYENFKRLLQFWKGYHMHQPSIFWRREVFEQVGYLDESLVYTMDFDYWLRIAQRFNFVNINKPLSYANYHSEAKTGDNYVRTRKEQMRHAHRYWPRRPHPTHYQFQISMYTHMIFLPRWHRFLALARYYPKRCWSLLTDRLRAVRGKNS